MFTPDYKNILDAANNIEARRLPLYEHFINVGFMEKILNKNFSQYYNGNYEDKKEYFRHYCGFYKDMGYDTVSFECCIGQVMPGSGALGGHIKGVISNREDYERYPWDYIPDMYFEKFGSTYEALRETLPEGMKAVGGPGNGIFECVQDLTGYMDLCFMKEDDPDLYACIFKKIGEVNSIIWDRFLGKYGDIYCVCRFGDDLGFKSDLLISDSDIRSLILPSYKRIIDLVHKHNKPFLLHSCGCIFKIMDDLIHAGIDAKHSNEDTIAPFSEWVVKYGDLIGNFGGIDLDAVCQLSKEELKEYISDVLKCCKGQNGIAVGSGNSIPDYVPAENYLNMIEITREARNE